MVHVVIFCNLQCNGKVLVFEVLGEQINHDLHLVLNKPAQVCDMFHVTLSIVSSQTTQFKNHKLDL